MTTKAKIKCPNCGRIRGCKCSPAEQAAAFADQQIEERNGRVKSEVESNFVPPYKSTIESLLNEDARGNIKIVDSMACSSCQRPIPIYEEGSGARWMDRTQARIQRGSFTMCDEDGDETPGEDNIKAEFYICADCYFTDPDLCAFFNKCGLRTR